MGRKRRKLEGPPARELRQVDQDPARIPPHKKKRDYVLTVEWREEQVLRRTMTFSSKDAREQAKLRVQREMRDKKWLSWAGWTDERTFRIKEGPTFTETMKTDGE